MAPRDTRTAETLRRVLESFAVDLHVSLPGRVRSYDRATQTAEVELAIRRVIPSGDDTQADTVEAYPILPSVPVLWPRSGGAFLHWNLQAGDGVLVVFSESDLNQWRATGEVSDPGLSTRHGLAGGVAIPGLHHRGNPLAGLSSEALGEIGAEDGPRIEFYPGQINAGGSETLALSSPLGSVLNAIVTDLAAIAAILNTAGPVVGAPGTVTVSTGTVLAANPIDTSTLRGA